VTGRTHQIRVHFAHAHHPVLGDPLYGVKGMPAAPRLMLHAWSLAFEHPLTGEQLRFTAMPEACFKAPKEAELLNIIL
jgi:23S rRNA pseudouridine1911/1915/1917 synthase